MSLEAPTQESSLISNDTTASNERGNARLMLAVFFLSGIAGLVYEISWARQIGLLFGHTIHAASIVLASYFSGMAFGYWIGARWLKLVRPLKGYAFAEIAVAAWAVAIPVVIQLFDQSQLATWLVDDRVAIQTLKRAVFSFLILLPATTGLGVTLPLMAEYFERQFSGQEKIAFAYSLNTAGALVGVLLATFVLLLQIGVTKSSYVAAVLSVVCATIALRSQGDDARAGGLGEGSKGPPEGHRSRTQLRVPMVLAIVSGLGTLGLQVFYTRMFSLVLHNSTYSFGVVVAVFLAALSIGAALAGKLQQRVAAPRLIGIALAAASLAVVGSVLVFVFWTELKYFNRGDSFIGYMFNVLMLVSGVVGPPIICLGMVLPLVWNMALEPISSKETGRGSDNTDCEGTRYSVGMLTAGNTLAASVGSLLASFWMLPQFGLWPSMIAIAAWLMLFSFFVHRQPLSLPSIVVTVLLLVFSFLVWKSPVEPNHDRGRDDEVLVKRFDSAYGWIDVVRRESDGAFKIRQNLHYRFGRTGDNAREYRQAHLPILLHPAPHDVLFMGLGTGLTAGGAIPHREVKKVVAVELIPEVIEATRLLADHNFQIIDHPKSKIFADDARHHLQAYQATYDVIVSDLFVPWESQSGYLYTVEHYRIAKQRLKEGGLFCQWLPLYQVGTREFESIANSFSNSFPHVTIWWGQLNSRSPMIALIGSERPLIIDGESMEARLKDLGATIGQLDPAIASPEIIWANYIGDWQRTQTPLNTDEYPRVEFLTPISNRERNMIRGPLLAEYFDEVFAALPAESASLKSKRGLGLSHQDRLSRQRKILFGER